MPQKLTASFDELLRTRYGDLGEGDQLYSLRIEDLFKTYYGGAATAAEKNGTRGPATAAVTLSVNSDNGERLKQTGRPARRREYVVRQSPIVSAPMSAPPAAPPRAVGRREPAIRRGAALPPEEASAAQEWGLDVLDPLRDTAACPPATSPVPAAMRPAAPPAPATPSSPQSQEDEFIADMKSILSGEMAYDPVTRKTVQKDALAQRTGGNGAAAPATGASSSAPEPKNGQAIFDRIAESLAYANTYDLGTIELENRFADFDTISDIQDRAAERRPAAPAPPAPPAIRKASAAAAPQPAAVDSEDVLRDLDAIRSQTGGQTPAPSQPAGRSMSVQRPYSEPLFDTGEHVRTGGNLYPDLLRVGPPPHVRFSYGQIIAMADLYESVDQMMAADRTELQRLKALIEQSTAHYTSRSASDPSTAGWDGATAGRYLRLAENNYEHFSPPPPIAGARPINRQHGDNKSAWEAHHRRAIEEAQRMFASRPDNAESIFFEWPLIINAFGDHYLTDAFASGHLINKEAMIDAFRRNFFDGTSLTAAGQEFFGRVARKAFTGEVARRFSAIETADYPVCTSGWCIRWHPNIDSPAMFARVLSGAAEAAPDRVANIAVKALHDRLNKDGIAVTNDAGDGSWTLKGDAFMDDRNLRIVHRAVQQSVDNINDPSIFASNLDLAAYFARVWRHVPRLPGASLTRLASLIDEYTSPDSSSLADAAARIIQREVDALVRALVSSGKLQAA